MKVCLECGERFAGAAWPCPRCGDGPTVGRYLSFAPYEEDIDGSFPDESGDRLAEVEQASFWFRSRSELIAWAIARYFPRAESFLDVGCGTGFLLAGLRERLPQLRLAGGDLTRGELEIACGRLPGVPLYRIDARRLPFDAEFAVLGAFDVIEHVDEDELVLFELARAVEPGGGVLVSVPQHPRLWSPVDELSLHRRRYRRRELVEKLEAAGLQILRTTSFVSFLLPAMFLRRRRSAMEAGYDPLSECSLPPVLDRWLERTMSAERLLIRSGVSLPAGGSLLAIARRPPRDSA